MGKIPWRRACQPTPVFLPSEFHGQRSLAGYSPWGGKGSDTTEPLSTYAATRKGRVSTRQGVRVGTSGMEHKQDWWLSSNPRMKKKKKYIPQSLLTLQTAAAAGFMRGREEMFTPIPPLLPFHPPNNHSPKITPLAFSEWGAGWGALRSHSKAFCSRPRALNPQWGLSSRLPSLKTMCPNVLPECYHLYRP